MRVIVRYNFARGLVISDHTWRRRVDAHPNRLAIHLDAVAKLNALTDVRGLGVDGNATFENQLLHLKARS